ncbi:MAG: excinuclease ABC subunit UvrC [Spirochaetota bacterium]
MLAERIRSVPDLPGVYLMKDAAGGIIYVGKAKSLKKRVQSYFNDGAKDPKTMLLVEAINDLDYIATQSEVEALLLEAELIKKHTPHFNIDLKDNKTYPFIKVTDEPFPRIYKTRTVTNDGRYFGPFVDVWQVREIIGLIERLYPIRTCRHTTFKRHAKCLNYHINKCKAPCAGIISEAEYRSFIDEAVFILEGKIDGLVELLTERMKRHAEGMEFEQAKALRDQISALDAVRVKQDVYVHDGENADVIGMYGENNHYTVILLSVRGGRLTDKRSFSVTGFGSTAEIMAEFIKRHYETIDAPAVIRVGEDIEDRDAIAAWLAEKQKSPVAIAYASGDTRRGILSIAYENARLTFRETHLTKELSSGVARLQSVFKFERPPALIEAFDIAHLMGSHTYASLVRFTNGVADKKNYRLFRIRTVADIDDPRSIREAVFRRYRRLVAEGKPMPDLILIDGGRAQLNAAIDALKELSIHGQKIIALAKRLEEIYLPNRDEPLRLPANDEGLLLLQRIRDEAHRFGNSRHARARVKGSLASVLERIEGVGPALRKRLLSHFKNIEAIKKADVHELSQVRGVSRSLAVRVRDHFTK